MFLDILWIFIVLRFILFVKIDASTTFTHAHVPKDVTDFGCYRRIYNVKQLDLKLSHVCCTVPSL